ncbi:MAG: hypothetical protein QG608_1958 [Actinomycetota bacterium]|nr:hypothetical protein [Actinomycetota bacterium]
MATYHVPRYDYPSQFGPLDELLPRIGDLLLNGDYVLGRPVRDFEESLAGYLGVPHVVGTNSGTDALVLALDALGIGPGDEVITVSNTFHATAMAIVRVGALPVLVDCRPDDYLIDLSQVDQVVTERTKALVIVHMFGRAVDMDAAVRTAERHGLLLVEDCAQAIGALSCGTPVGSRSSAGCWSFAPSKNLAAAGDAGAISVSDPVLAANLRRLRHFGQVKQNYHEVIGYNSRLDSVQALVLSHKLAQVDGWNLRRREIAGIYRSSLRDLPVSFQDEGSPGEHVYHLFQMRSEHRDGLINFLQEHGTDAVVRYPLPLHLQEAFQDLNYAPGDFPVSEDLARTTLCLPLHPSLRQDQIDSVTDAVHEFFSEMS